MRRRASISVVAVLLIVSSLAPAQAQPPAKPAVWKSIGAWSILASVDGKCAAVIDWPDGRFLALSWVARLNRTVVTVGDAKWQSIRDAVPYDVVLHLPPGPPQPAAAKGLRDAAWGNRPTLLLAGEGRALLDRIARADALEIEYRGEIIARLGLTGSAAAIAAMMDCLSVNGRPPGASPATRPPTQEVGRWTVERDASGSRCIVRTLDVPAGGRPNDMVFMLLDYLREERAFALVLGSPAWDLREDQVHKVELHFDGRPPVTFRLRTARVGSQMTLAGKEADMLDRLADLAGAARTKIVLDDGRKSGVLPIDGSAQAVAVLRDCQAIAQGTKRP